MIEVPQGTISSELKINNECGHHVWAPWGASNCRVLLLLLLLFCFVLFFTFITYLFLFVYQMKRWSVLDWGQWQSLGPTKQLSWSLMDVWETPMFFRVTPKAVKGVEDSSKIALSMFFPLVPQIPSERTCAEWRPSQPPAVWTRQGENQSEGAHGDSCRFRGRHRGGGHWRHCLCHGLYFLFPIPWRFACESGG